MAQIAGLRGVLPEPSKVNEVAAARGAHDVGKLLASGSLVRDPGRAVYRYHQAFSDGARTIVRKLVACAVRLEAWSEGSIRPHQATVEARRVAELAALRATGAQRAPILVGYRDAASEVERLFRRAEGERPTVEVATPDGTTHRLWRVQSAELFGKLRHLFAPKRLSVLDGHARYEAHLAYRDELAAKRALAMYSSANYVLACLADLDDPTLSVSAHHRVVRKAAPSATALAAARAHFIVEKLAGAGKDFAKQRAALAETVAHQPAFVVAWAGEPDAWKLTLSPDVSPSTEGVQVHRALQKLDPVITDSLFVARTMPGATLETATQLEGATLAAGDATITMRPLGLEQVSHAIELGQVLPASSTAFLPALAPGLIGAVIDPDEDLV